MLYLTGVNAPLKFRLDEMFTGRRAGRAASIAYEGSGGPFRCGLDLDIKRADLLAMHAAVRRLTAIDEMLGIVPTPYVSIDFVSAPIPTDKVRN